MSRKQLQKTQWARAAWAQARASRHLANGLIAEAGECARADERLSRLLRAVALRLQAAAEGVEHIDSLDARERLALLGDLTETEGVAAAIVVLRGELAEMMRPRPRPVRDDS